MKVQLKLHVYAILLFALRSTVYSHFGNESSIANSSKASVEKYRTWLITRGNGQPFGSSRGHWFLIQRHVEQEEKKEGTRREEGAGEGEKEEEEEEEQERKKKDEEKRNCTKRSIEQFPKDIFTLTQRRRGAVLLHVLLGFYCFALTAYVCNDYLLPSLDCICADMNISGDVAGATFLATANCFPELFVNVIGTFLTESDLGVGTVVGGAVFNTFATPACGALLALYGIQLEWRILTRDCIIYVISVGTLVSIMWDSLIVWYEAIILMALFFGYAILLFCGKTLARWYGKIVHLCSRQSGDPRMGAIERIDEPMSQGLYKPYFHSELIAEYKRKSCAKSSGGVSLEEPKGKAELDSKEYTEPADTPFVWPKDGTPSKVWFLLVWPIKFILFLTIPDSRFERCRSWYPITFVMCVAWIAVSSYMTSWMMTVVGDTLGIADSIMGITFLSAGGNMPELVSIVILSRQGNGDMAMSNTLGANTLDILLCLGLPWTIKTIMTGRDVEIVSGALTYSVLSIIVCVLAFYSVTAFYKFTLNKKVGVICLVLYLIFLTLAILIELNIFFFVNLPMCDYSFA